jgi:hypothetical protein
LVGVVICCCSGKLQGNYASREGGHCRRGWQ